jgi:rSAM/selenodomain-associated transferase 2
MTISVIIPVYNEAENISKIVGYLLQHKDRDVIEIIVVDAASTDETLTLAKEAGAVTVISTQKGRAAQMNYGASAANGDILYFVHADTLPPASYSVDIITAVTDGYAIGRYRTKFNSNKWYLKINAWFTRFDWFICYGGDQSLFVTKKLFDKTGGFVASMKIMEEYEYTQRARKEGRYKIFPKATLISARKYDTNTWWQVQMANRKIVKMYKKGAGQDEMVNMYKRMLKYR